MRGRRYKYHRNVCWRLEFPFAIDLYASLSFQAMRNSGDASKEKPAMVGQRTMKDYIFRPPEELYGLDDDPGHKSKLLEMRKALEQWQNDTQDLWLWRDGTSVWRYRMHGCHRDGLQIPDRFDFDPENPGTWIPQVCMSIWMAKRCREQAWLLRDEDSLVGWTPGSYNLGKGSGTLAGIYRFQSIALTPWYRIVAAKHRHYPGT